LGLSRRLSPSANDSDDFSLVEQTGCPANLPAIHVNVLPCCFGDEGQFVWRDPNNLAVLVVELLDYGVFLALKRIEMQIQLGSTSKLRSGKFAKGVQEGIVKQTKRKTQAELQD
jgi:hypothetical protein